MITRIVLVTKETAMEELLLKHYTMEALKFHLESIGQSVDEFREQDKKYREALSLIRSKMPTDINSVLVTRNDIPNFLFYRNDLIIICGPDGLLVNAGKFILEEQPVITINPDPSRINGVLMIHEADQKVGELIQKVRMGNYNKQEITLAKAQLSDGNILYAVNEFLIGRSDNRSSYYKIKYDNQEEQHSSSGVIIATGVGSSGWTESIISSAERLTESESPLRVITPAWGDNHLLFIVREGFTSNNSFAEISFGKVDERHPLELTSTMPHGGSILSDGVTENVVTFDAGTSVIITPAKKKLCLVI